MGIFQSKTQEEQEQQQQEIQPLTQPLFNNIAENETIEQQTEELNKENNSRHVIEEETYSDSESESEQMERMYGFTKKTVSSDIKRPENPLKRKLISISKSVPAEEDTTWMSHINLQDDTPLIKLGDVVSHITNVIVIKADNEYTTGYKIWDEQQKEKQKKQELKTEPEKKPLVFNPPIAPIVVAPGYDAMNVIVEKRMKQKQRGKMMKNNEEFKKEEEEWKKTIILRVGEGTIVFNENRQPIGRISDMFGPVHQPYYKVVLSNTPVCNRPPENKPADENKKIDENVARDNETNEIEQPQSADSTTEKDTFMEVNEQQSKEPSKENSIPTVASENTNMVGKVLYFVIQHSNIMNVSNVIDMTIKGSDATGERDEELNPEEVEYSDDEEERAAKKRRRTSFPSPYAL
jgi:hypothetical protein